MENMFDVLRQRMKAEVKENIIRQTWDEFVQRIKLHVWSMSQQYIGQTIASIPNEMKENLIETK